MALRNEAEQEGNLVVLRELIRCMTPEAQTRFRAACIMLKVASDEIQASTNGICEAPNIAIQPSPPVTVCDDPVQHRLAKSILRGTSQELFFSPLDVVNAIGQWREAKLFIPSPAESESLVFDKLVPPKRNNAQGES
jgi:hypothetical protein